MSKEILISVKENETRVAIIEDGKLDDFYIEVDRYENILGNIYKGKVESILPSINGAFVNIGQEKNGFLYLTDAINPLVADEISPPRQLLNKLFNKKKPPRKVEKNAKPMQLKEGQEILVQIVKEPFATKGARLTTHLSLAGRFVVYMPYDPHVGVSRRIGGLEERKRLRAVLKEFTFAKTGGFIVRTASMGQGKRELTRDAKFLTAIWREINKRSKQKSAPSLIYEEYKLISKIVRDYLTKDVTRLLIDSEEECLKLRKLVENLIGKQMVNKIQYYKGDTPLFEAKKVSNELNKVYNRKVYLKSGSHIVIEPTEGLIVVDVNSGSFKTKATPEEAAFLVNVEAAVEIARQLRLRDLGGIIVIDFIDMNREMHKRKVLAALQKSLSKDHAKTEIGRISSLGLVEMTRARAGKTLESLSFENCPYCDGRGRVKIS